MYKLTATQYNKTMDNDRFQDRNPVAFLAMSYGLWIRHIVADIRGKRRK